VTFKKFLDNIDNIYADQGDKPESERLRYGQIIMMELWSVWPKKYHEIIESDKDPFYSDILHKKPYDLLSELEKEWPVFPDKREVKNYSIPSSEQIRIQRLEKKIKKLQASNKRHSKNLEFYQKLTRNFPWVERNYTARLENSELRNELDLKTWAVKGLKHDLEYLDNQITDDMIKVSEQLAVYVGDSYSIINGKTISGTDIIKQICAVVKNIKKSINLHQIRKNKNEN
jgi:hypothetical protein